MTWPAPACTCTSASADDEGRQPVRQRGPGRHARCCAQRSAACSVRLLDSLLLFCPNANSYRRFQANSYAPLAPTWGVDNRTVSLRVPGGPANTRHIEHRICGADANPYLAAAAILAGIHRGISEEPRPGRTGPGQRLRAGYAIVADRLADITDGAGKFGVGAGCVGAGIFWGVLWRSSVRSIGSSWRKWVSRIGAGI